MPTGMPDYQTGLTHKSATVVGYTRSAAGVFTADTGGSLTDLLAVVTFSEMDYQRMYEMIDTRPTNVKIANNVQISQDFELTVSEFLRPGFPSILKAIANSFNYAKVTFSVTPDAGTTTNLLESVIGAIKGDSVRYERESNRVSLTLVAAGTGPF